MAKKVEIGNMGTKKVEIGNMGTKKVKMYKPSPYVTDATPFDTYGKIDEALGTMGTGSNLLSLDFSNPNKLLAALGMGADTNALKQVDLMSPLFLKRAEMIRQRNTAPGRAQTLLTGQRNLLG